MRVYRSDVFSIPLYRTNQNMIGIGLLLLTLNYTSFLSSKIGLFLHVVSFRGVS
jgi:hypothetical protein